MRLGLFFAIALVILAIVAIVLTVAMYRLSLSQAKQIQSLTEKATNLAAAKDFQTYANLTTLADQQSPAESPLPLDDVSMAHALAERYAEHNIDPSRAYANDDDIVAEFDQFKNMLGLEG